MQRVRKFLGLLAIVGLASLPLFSGCADEPSSAAKTSSTSAPPSPTAKGTPTAPTPGAKAAGASKKPDSGSTTGPGAVPPVTK
jgi:hypothetical protein